MTTIRSASTIAKASRASARLSRDDSPDHPRRPVDISLSCVPEVTRAAPWSHIGFTVLVFNLQLAVHLKRRRPARRRVQDPPPPARRSSTHLASR